MSRHLHPVGSTTLFFVPDGDGHLALQSQRRPPMTAGKVVLELKVTETHEETAVRGEVVAYSEGLHRGTWLQLTDSKLAQHLNRRRTFAMKREHRLCTSQVLQLADSRGTQSVVQLLDVSAGGMRIRGVSGLVQGAIYETQILGGRRHEAGLGAARVVRLDGAEAGLRFEQRTPALTQFLEGLQRSWDQARKVAHPAGCCGSRGTIEPALPRKANAFA
ncbi:MAG: hypothetical protein JST92_09430 [Deltaproteobacteria bacterium]|nr:hypothetical protein [Deltaproteobacteria bacterium]